MELKLNTQVWCREEPAGVVSRVIIDPVTKDVSHFVLMAGEEEYVIPLDARVSAWDGKGIRLEYPIETLHQLPLLRREDYVDLKEVEIAGVESRLEIAPGAALVPVPQLERSPTRRQFFAAFSNAIAAVLAVPLLYPILRYLVHPLYPAFNNLWVKIGSTDRFTEQDKPRQVKFTKNTREGFLEREFEKSHWIVRASPPLLEEIYGGKDREFRDQSGKVFWTNSKDQEFVVFSGKCPHLGCAYKWKENHKKFGRVFWCPCHLSIYKLDGEVVSGPAPRRLDVLPVRVRGNTIEIVDAEFKAGKKEQFRVI